MLSQPKDPKVSIEYELITGLLDLLIDCECPHGPCRADHNVEERARVVVGWSQEEAQQRLGRL